MPGYRRTGEASRDQPDARMGESASRGLRDSGGTNEPARGKGQSRESRDDRSPRRRPSSQAVSNIAKQIGGAADRHVMRRWRRIRPRPVDRFLGKLSGAGEHSQLWLALAALAAIFGGQPGKRAARHGLLAVGFSSAMVNGLLKVWVHRRRPPPHRVLRRRPRSWSFPSGHAASAFAFATAASREMPEAGPVLVPLAAAMAYSRVYLGVRIPAIWWRQVLGLLSAAAGITMPLFAPFLGIDKAPSSGSRQRPGCPSRAVSRWQAGIPGEAGGWRTLARRLTNWESRWPNSWTSRMATDFHSCSEPPAVNRGS